MDSKEKLEEHYHLLGTFKDILMADAVKAAIFMSAVSSITENIIQTHQNGADDKTGRTQIAIYLEMRSACHILQDLLPEVEYLDRFIAGDTQERITTLKRQLAALQSNNTSES